MAPEQGKGYGKRHKTWTVVQTVSHGAGRKEGNPEAGLKAEEDCSFAFRCWQVPVSKSRGGPPRPRGRKSTSKEGGSLVH